MLKTLLKLALVNAIGASIAPLVYIVDYQLGGVPMAEMPQEFSDLYRWFVIGGTMWAWLVGFIISPLVFLVKGLIRKIIFSLPVVLPLIYGLSSISIF